MDNATWLEHPILSNYEVSNNGRVRSLPHVTSYMNNGTLTERRFPGRELKGWVHPSGYRVVTIRAGNKGNPTRKVHILVCETFHGLRPSTDHWVRHLNGNPLDNRADNLAWGTPTENNRDTVQHGRNRNAIKTQCASGHDYTDENTYWSPDRRRQCRKCIKRHRAKTHERRRRERAAKRNAPM